MKRRSYDDPLFADAAIIEAARSMSCRLVLSEDFSAGQDYDGIVVENPFV